jgi:plasmid stability protein
MATLTTRNLPEEVRNHLRVAAARNGRSMEAEARATLVQKFARERTKVDPGVIRERIQLAQKAIARHLPGDRQLLEEFLADRKKMWGEE